MDSPLKGGHYLDSHAMLKIKVELAYPLITPNQLATKEELETTNEVRGQGRVIFTQRSIQV